MNSRLLGIVIAQVYTVGRLRLEQTRADPHRDSSIIGAFPETLATYESR